MTKLYVVVGALYIQDFDYNANYKTLNIKFTTIKCNAHTFSIIDYGIIKNILNECGFPEAKFVKNENGSEYNE